MPTLRKTFIALLAVSFGLSACANPDGTANNTGTGTLIGGTLGALIGSRVSGDDKKGAIIGGIVGGIAGATIGSELDRQEAALRADIGDGGVRIVNTGDQLIVTLPEEISFDFDSTRVKSRFVGSIRSVAVNLRQYPDNTVGSDRPHGQHRDCILQPRSFKPGAQTRCRTFSSIMACHRDASVRLASERASRLRPMQLAMAVSKTGASRL